MSEYSLLSNTNMAMTKNILVEYNPNDFFYAVASNENMMPDTDTCDKLDVHDPAWDISCNRDNFTDNRNICIDRELCVNKENVDELMKIKNRHNGADEKYLNTNAEYSGVILNTINLGIGIILLGGLIYKFRHT